MIAVENEELDLWLPAPLSRGEPEIVASLRVFRALGNAVEDRRRGIGIGALPGGRREGEFRAAGEDGGCHERNPRGILTDRLLTMHNGLGVGSTSNSRDGWVVL